MTKVTLWSSSAGDIAADLAFKNNYAATAVPSSTDDVSDGYTVGSTWVYGATTYTCTTATAGAAVWTAVVAPKTQAAPVAKTVTATLTAANLLVGMITVAQGAGASSTQTLPTGTLMQAALPSTFAVNDSFDFSIINIGASGETAILAAGTNFTIVGGTSIAISTSATFRVRKTAANTFVAYRIAG